MFTAIDLFAGQGGLTAGFQRVKDWYHLAAVEKNAGHCRILRQIFPDLNVIQNDVSSVDWKSVLKGAEVDCVVGGPPCQPFSVGGRHWNGNGWDDECNGIPTFVDIVRILKPKAFLMENVASVWWTSYRHHIQGIIDRFKEMGFVYTDAAVLDAADFGAPCHRKRLFVYGTQLDHSWLEKTHVGAHVGAREFLVPLLQNRKPDGAPIPEWAKPKVKGVGAI